MLERFSCLRRKEVVNVCDGCRLGYVGDLEIKYPEVHGMNSMSMAISA